MEGTSGVEWTHGVTSMFDLLRENKIIFECFLSQKFLLKN